MIFSSRDGLVVGFGIVYFLYFDTFDTLMARYDVESDIEASNVT